MGRQIVVYKGSLTDCCLMAVCLHCGERKHQSMTPRQIIFCLQNRYVIKSQLIQTYCYHCLFLSSHHGDVEYIFFIITSRIPHAENNTPPVHQAILLPIHIVLLPHIIPIRITTIITLLLAETKVRDHFSFGIS